MPKEIYAPGLNMTCTPPTIAMSQLLVWIDSMALCRATNELEHAVSMGALGPRRLSRNETRLAKTEWELPEAVYPSRTIGRPLIMSRQSFEPTPTNSPVLVPA